MLHLYHSNKTEILLARLAAELTQPVEIALRPEVLLVQNPGMAHWLNIQLAELFGIAANIQYPLPSSFTWRLLRQLNPSLPEISPLDKGPLGWFLFSFLPSVWEQPDFAFLKAYAYQGSRDTPSPRAQFQLAVQLADVFDQYTVFRPDWIQQWERCQYNTVEPEHQWQGKLWRHTLECLEQRGVDDALHRTEIWQDTLKQATPEQMQAILPPRLFLFGLSSMPPSMMDVFEQLAQWTEVHWFVLNPCEQYWGDIQDEKRLSQAKAATHKTKAHDVNQLALDFSDDEPNEPSLEDRLLQCPQPLLASMGKQGRDYLDALFDMAHEEEALFSSSHDRQNGALLHRIQHQILNLEDGRKSPESIGMDDHSLVIHRCYSPLREVEVLYDALLEAFERDPELRPRDVIVMIPDVVAYAPFIEAVFGNAPEDRRIPWSISDRPQEAEHPLIECFMELLLLTEQRLTLTELFRWLELDAVQARLELSTEDVEQLREWVQASHLCWGLNAQHKASFDVPGDDQFSWHYTLRRMLMGYATKTPNLEEGLVPLAQIEGIQVEAIGALADWLEALDHHLAYLKSPHTVTEWVAYWFELLERLFADTDSTSEALAHIRNALQRLMQELLTSGEDPVVDHWVLFDALKSLVQSERSAQRFFVGYVNFCTLMPMRSIPFKIVCLLGMNDSDYPRSVTPLHLDLLNQYYRKGDRSRREDDRYLFLEAILSARQQFILSYRHRNIRDNSALAPSVLLSELMDYCDEAFYRESACDLANAEKNTSSVSFSASLYVDHPLQPFHPDYFNPEKTLASYQSQWLIADDKMPVEKINWSSAGVLLEQKAQWNLDGFLRAFRHLPRYFMQERFGVHWFPPEEAPDSIEPFGLNPLKSWQLRQALLRARLAGENETLLLERWQYSGLIPKGTVGKAQIDIIQADLEPMWSSALPWLEPSIGETSVQREIQIQCQDGGRIEGWLSHQNTSVFVDLYPGKDHRKALFQWALKHMMLCASESDSLQESRWFGLEQQWRLPPIALSDARDYLNICYDVLRNALEAPQPFMDALSFDFIDPSIKDASKRLIKAQQRWLERYEHPQEYYLTRVFSSNEMEEWLHNAEQLAQKLYGPLLEWWEQVS